jgi:3',5'-cyclic AMP phosphodiesterase CpdA
VVTLLHISDTQFGPHHRFPLGANSLADGLVRDVKVLTDQQRVPRPDVVVHSGDLTEYAKEEEFEAAHRFADTLLSGLELGPERFVVVPGNHDINYTLSRAYFRKCSRKGEKPVPPYFPKWIHFANFARHVGNSTSNDFEERPYALHKFDDLRLVIAGLNSTIDDSHRKADNYGWCGEPQLAWFARELEHHKAWHRVAIVHHNARPQNDIVDKQRLRDAGLVTSLLGPSIDILLHGHTHDGKTEILADGTIVLGIGSAAVKSDLRPPDVGNQYQIVSLRPGSVERLVRRYQHSQRRWVDDPSLSRRGDAGLERIVGAPSHPMSKLATVIRDRINTVRDNIANEDTAGFHLHLLGQEVFKLEELIRKSREVFEVGRERNFSERRPLIEEAISAFEKQESSAETS